MRKFKFLAILVIGMVGITFAACDSKQSVRVKSELDSVSYVLGANWGTGLKEQIKSAPGPELNWDVFVDGIRNGGKGDTLFLGMDIQEATAYINNYFQNIEIRLAEESKIESDKFFEENKTKSGVITTESGLQYQIITQGTGPKPSLESTVKVHYHGTLLNGEVFESSYERGEPIDWIVGNFIEGWKEGLQLMQVGSKYKFWIPIELAYYNDPQNPLNNKALVFEVELLEILNN